MSTMLEVPDHLAPALTRMLVTLAKKKADYAGEDAWSNFRATSKHFGLELYEAGDFNEIQKLSRLETLRKSNGPPQNESVEDTYLDKANFALLAYAMYLYVADQKLMPIPESLREDGSVIRIDGRDLRTVCGHSFATCHTNHCFLP